MVDFISDPRVAGEQPLLAPLQLPTIRSSRASRMEVQMNRSGAPVSQQAAPDALPDPAVPVTRTRAASARQHGWWRIVSLECHQHINWLQQQPRRR